MLSNRPSFPFADAPAHRDTRNHPNLRRSLLALCLALPVFGWADSFDDFFTAVRNDRASTVRELLAKGFDPNARDARGTPALMLAVREDSVKVADVLMSHPKIQVEQRNAQDESALMYAAIKGNLPLAKRLIEKNADVVKTGWTPLHYAASKGHLDLMRLLLEHHAYIDAESPNKTTPLMMAAMYGTEDAVKLLMEEGADASLRNDLGMTVEDFATKAGRPNVIKIVRQQLEERRAAPAARAAASQVAPASATLPSSPSPSLPQRAASRPVGKW